MAKKRRKKGHKRSRLRRDAAKPRGFDFGCLPYAMAMGSLELPGQLGDASIIGVGYGERWSHDLGARVPSITLVAQQEQPLVDAFATLDAWADSTDPDSVELTIILRSDGGYLLAISPETQRLTQRCLGFDRTHVAITAAVMWVKPINTAHPFLRQLQDYARSPVAPFLLDGAVYDGDPSVAPSPSYLREITSVNPLLKFEVTIIDEADVQPDTTAALALAIASAKTAGKGSAAPPPRSPSDVTRLRVKSLRTHFPVTLERCRYSKAITTLVRELAPIGIRAWQIEQALCNLVLSSVICNDLHYRCLSASKLEDSVIAALGDLYEIATDQPIPDVTAESLQVQVLADTNTLLRCLKLRSAKTVEDGLETLRAASLLDAPTAVSNPLSW